MRDTIYTIPISEVFEPKDTCPFCRLHDTLEQRGVEYIMGAAMMEPDIRIETNKQGFCGTHFSMMAKRKNRLSLALMLESHLDELLREVQDESPMHATKRKEFLQNAEQSCYICGKIENAMATMLSTMFRMYAKEESFRQLYAEQPCLCLKHYNMVAAAAPKQLPKKELKAFLDISAGLTQKYLLELKGDISHFCKMFDYRNSGEKADWGNSKTAVERAVWYLTSTKPE